MDQNMYRIYYPILNYDRDRYQSWMMRKLVALSLRILNKYDALRDWRTCGQSLARTVVSERMKSMGSTASQPAHYFLLESIFAGECFTKDDRLIDVGCGKGRILAYLEEQHFLGQLYGIELDQTVLACAKSWCGKYRNIALIEGNALEADYDPYTGIFLARPFETETFFQFIDHLEETLTHSVRFYYLYDQQSGHYLNEREGWTIHRREWIFRKHGFYVGQTPQRYSVWTYTPPKR